MRERFAGFRVLRIVPSPPRHMAATRRPRRSPYAGAVCLCRFRAPGTLSGPRLSWRAAKGMISPDTKALGGAGDQGTLILCRLPDVT
jgi:hypothetical protein